MYVHTQKHFIWINMKEIMLENKYFIHDCRSHCSIVQNKQE